MSFTASKTALAIHCRAWEKLPQDNRVGDAARIGTRVHRALQARAEGIGNPRSYLQGDEEVRMYTAGEKTIAAYEAAEWGITAETAIGLRTGGGPSWGPEPLLEERAYPDIPGMVFGTIDVLFEMPGEAVVILDWKTGRGTGAPQQLATLALAYMRSQRYEKLGRPVVYTAVAYLDDGYVDRKAFTVADALEHEARLNVALEADRGPVPGPHCASEFCPAVASCPAVRSWMERSARQALEGMRADLAANPEARELVLAQAAKRAADGVVSATKAAGLPVRLGRKVFSEKNGKWTWRIA